MNSIRFLFHRLLRTSIKRKMVLLIVGLATVTPTLLVALLATTYYYLGIESLFNEKINTSLSETVKIAELYLEEHNATIKADIMGVAKDIERNSSLLSENTRNFDDLWLKEAELRSISEAMVFSRNHHIISKTFSSLSLHFEKIAADVLDAADRGEVVVLDNRHDDKVRAIIKLFSFDDAYLLIGRDVDQKILNHLESTQGSQAQYQSLLADIGRTRAKLGLAFILLSMALCVASILIAINLARKIAKPINQLVSATAQIKDGNFSVRVPERPGRDETSILTRAFNQMTAHIEQQTKELKQVNAIVDERRRFIETVLKEISAGLLVVNTHGKITLCNQSAYALLDKTEGSVIGKNYHNIIAEIGDLIEKANNNPGVVISDSVTLQRRNKDISLFVRASAEVSAAQTILGYIITMDDMTTLVTAQRAAAWGEVARRIAHEIKNPLTPINLAAERLLHKFSKQIVDDQELFKKYVGTIIHHVEDIGNIVEDFVQLAKTPTHNIMPLDISKIIDEVKFSHESIAPNVQIIISNKAQGSLIMGDKTQISQVMVNLIKNAIEAIEAKREAEDVNLIGKISIAINSNKDEKQLLIKIEDNGIGIPKKLLSSIHDPYVTTKANGTGLGLAIVKKIIEDHGGAIEITSNKKAGACVHINLPVAK